MNKLASPNRSQLATISLVPLISWAWYSIVANKFENKIHKEIGEIISSYDKNKKIGCINIPTAYSNPSVQWKLNPSNPHLVSSLDNLLKKYPYDNIKISYNKYPYSRYVVIKEEQSGLSIEFTD